jgi:hypothetical protein
MATPRVVLRTKSESRPRTASASESGERESAGFRAALPVPSSLTPATPQAVQDEELDQRIFALVTAVSENDGMGLPPEWLIVADAAKRRGYLNEHNLRLYLADLGRQWLALRSAPANGPKTYTMTKIDPQTRMALKDISRESRLPMQEAITHIVDAVHANRDALTRLARKHGRTYPWEAIRHLVKG